MVQKRIEKVMEYLNCDLTTEELKNYSELMADAWRKKVRAEENLKSASTQIKSEIAACEAQVNNYSEKVNSKQEYRQVECKVDWDFKKRLKRVIRLDTDEVVKEMVMSPEECQEALEV